MPIYNHIIDYKCRPRREREPKVLRNATRGVSMSKILNAQDSQARCMSQKWWGRKAEHLVLEHYKDNSLAALPLAFSLGMKRQPPIFLQPTVSLEELKITVVIIALQNQTSNLSPNDNFPLLQMVFDLSISS